jgi:hypothetical protein
MNRREFITLLGGGGGVAGRGAQQPMPVIGFLTSLRRNDRADLAEAFPYLKIV